MPLTKNVSRLLQARPASRGPARWCAAMLLLLCALLTPAASHAAPPAEPVAAPLAQSQTVERWVDGFIGSNVMEDEDGDEIPSTCTRQIIPPDPDDDEDTEEYRYNSCKTISYALAIANPGDIIRVVGGIPHPSGGAPLLTVSYPEVVTIKKKITIIGGYQIGFGAQIDPTRYNSLPTTIVGVVVAQGTSAIPFLPPSVSGEGPMEVRLDGISVTQGGIDIHSNDDLSDFFYPNTVHVTLENVTVYGVHDYGSGIHMAGTNNKLAATKTLVTNNWSSSRGGGIYAGAGTILDLGAGTTVSNNWANNSGNGAGIAAQNAATVTIGGGVTVTLNTGAVDGGGIYAENSNITIGSDTFITNNSAGDGGGLFLIGGNNSVSGATINFNSASGQGGGLFTAFNAPTLENLEIKQNGAPQGAGVFVHSPTGGTLGSSDLISNTASSTGGGYFINGGSAFTATSLIVQGNSATQHGGGGYVTGASNTAIQGNDFTNNSVNNNGGGLFVISSAARLQGNTFSGNSANSGGGLYLENSNNTWASSSVFDGNTANFGGGLYLTNNNGSSFSGLDLIDNHANSDGGGLYATSNPGTAIGAANVQGNTSGDQGAGLYAINATLTFTTSAFFEANLATNEGGGGYVGNNALLTFTSFDMQENEAKAGGGFYTDGGRVIATSNTSFVSNKATGGNGGALYLKGSGSTASAISSLFAQNNEANNGGAFFAEGVNLTFGTASLTGNEAKSGSGGGLYFTNSTVTFLNAATFLENEASQHGGALFANATTITYNNGAMFNGNSALGGDGGGAYLTTSSAKTVAFRNSTFSENIAASDGGGIYASAVTITISPTTNFEGNIAQAGNGGGFYVTGSSLSLAGVSFKSNRAFVSGGGGYFTTGTLTIPTHATDALYDDNRAQTGNGGGLAVQDATSVVIDDATFTSNLASVDGGAVYASNSPLTVQNGLNFTTNGAGRGGAIFVSGSNTTLSSLTFSKNTATNGGGALHITTGNLTLQNSTFSENNGGITTGTGGGAYLKATTATLTNNNFSKNLATSGAGLYLADTPNATLTTAQFIENSSSGGGGALYLNNSTVGLNLLTVRANQAAGEGGGIYALFSRVGMTNTLLVNNKTSTLTTYGAGVYVGNTVLHVTHSTIANNSHTQLQGSAHAFYVAPPVAASGGAPAASSLTLVNSIVSGQAVGVNLLAGNSATFNSVLWQNDHFNWTGAGTFSVTRSRRGDPRFVNISGNDFHLRRDSAAFDQGISTSVGTDLDGVARTQSLAPDLGAYEHRYTAGLYLTANIAPAFVQSDGSVTLQLRVRNQSASTANNVILRATLPSQLPAPGIDAGSCQGIFCTVELGSLAPGADVTVEINAGVSGTPLSNGLLTLLTNVTLQTSNFSTSDTATSVTAYLHSCRADLAGTVYPTVQAAMDAASNGQTIRISGVCGDLHQNGGPGQLLTINKSVTLQGGWNSTFTTLNPAAFPTILDAGALGRVIYLNGNFAPTLENLIIRNGSASALGGGPGGKDAGGGLYLNGSTVTLNNVDIANNQSPDLGGGVYLASATVNAFVGGFVRNNTAGERGGGLYVNESAPTFTGVTVSGNTARGGGGVYLYRSPAQFIDTAASGLAPTCRIESNSSTVMPNYVPGPTGGGLPVLWLAPGGGGGIVLDESAATMRGCALHANSARVGGGAYVHNSSATIENTLFTSNRAQQTNPNTILIGPGGVMDGDGGGLVLDNQDPTAITLRGVLLGSNQGVRGSGMLTRLARGGTLTLPHFTINSNSGGPAIFALGESRLAFKNSIVAFNTGGAALFAQNGSGGETASITLDYTLYHPPTQVKTGSSNGGSVTSNTEFTGDPAFKDDGYHIKRISFAFGAGQNSYTFADRDGNARPVGGNVDLGADEYATAVTTRYVALGGAGSAPCTDYRSPCNSLQTALDASSNGDFIKMAGGSYSGTRNDGGRLHHALISKSVTIEGGYFPRTDNNTVTERLFTFNDWESPHPLETPTVIDVNDQGRVFFISGNVAPTLSFLTLRRGNALTQGDGPPGSTGGAGGGVYVDGASPIFKNVLVEDSRALFGSGFYLRNANGTYTGLTVLENGVGVANARGGGFYVQGGQPTFQSMVVQANIAITGAGFYLDNSAAVLLQNTVQSNGNSTTLDGGGLYVITGTASLITNTIATNQAQHGGGVRLHNANGTVRGNTINNNRAGTTPAPSGQNDGLGGGLYIVGGAPLITANTISNNQAVHPLLSYGGGLYIGQTGMSLSGNTINANQAHRGGGIYFASTTQLTVQNNTINSNIAQAPNENLRASGGGVYLATATITLTTNTVNQNSAPYGAGFYVVGAGQSLVQGNSLTSNTATKDGGGFYLDGSDARLESNTLTNNRTTGGRGGGIYARNGQASLRQNTLTGSQATLEGGGIFFSSDGSTLQGGTIQDSVAGDGAGLYIDGPAPGAAQSQPWINQVTFAENSASNHGGALFVRTSGAQITLNLLRDNQAAVDGGGAYIQESTLAAFSSNVIRDNSAGDQGGGLYITRRTTGRYQSNAIIDNGALQGGGIYVGGASPTLVNTTLARNNSALIAAALDGNATTVVLTNTIVANHPMFGILGEDGATVDLFATLWDGNGVNSSGTVSSNGEFGGAPNFQDDGYHLNPDSAAANRGISGDVAIGNDVDNEGRFQGSGPELGADELTADCEIIVEGAPQTVYNNLQEAITRAPLNGVLLVAGTCTGVEINDGTPQLAYFSQNVTVRGGYSSGNWAVSSPSTHPTVLDAQTLGRVVRISNSNARVVLENLTLLNGTAAGLGDGPNNADAGGNLFIDAGQLVLSGVDVVNGHATVGGGVYIKAPSASLTNNNFRNNLATLHGGALYLDTAPTSVDTRTSRFTNNRAVDGGAIYAAAGTPIILGNTFRENQATGNSGRGGGIYLATSNANVNRNTLESNRAGLGGGMYISAGTPSLTNNLFVRNVGITNAGALYSINSPLNLRHSTVVANSTVQSGGSAIFFATPIASQVLTLTNNIIVDHSLAISVAAGNQLLLQTTLWHNNQTNVVGPVTASNDLQGDPLFVNRATGNYRLVESSPAVDNALNIGVTDDIDGQARPARQGFDIGADEYLRASVTANLTALPNPVAAGTDQTYVLQVANNGDVNIVARIQITLPNVLSPQGATIWENVAIARGAIWNDTLAATVDADYTGALNAVMVVTSQEGATASATADSVAASISGKILDFSGESLPNPAEPGSEVELSLRIVNHGGIPVTADVRAQLPEGLTAAGPVDFSPTIAGPEGIWSTRIRATVSADVPTRTQAGEFNELVTLFTIDSPGTSETFEIVTTLAQPDIEVSRVPTPRPALAGRQLIYTLFVTNTGNVPLQTTISNTFPAQVALDDPSHALPIPVTLAPDESFRLPMTTTVEAGYVGPLLGGVNVTTNAGVSDSAQDALNAQKQPLNPTATAKGGDWFDPESWEPPGVPAANALVLIPEDVELFSDRPITIFGIINRGKLELRTGIGASQALTLTSVLENYGEILGRDGSGNGQAGLTLNLNSGILYNEGTICAGNGAPNGGPGGDLIIVAGSTTNKGIFCAGHGANVNNPVPAIPGGPGGDVFLSFDPGLFTNLGQVLAGNGGNRHPDAVPPQNGGNGGDVTIVAAAAARLNDSDVRAGTGGESNGDIGRVVIGAPIINSIGTRFSNGTVLLFDQSNDAYDFAAIGPDLVAVSPRTGIALFSIRIYNRGARQDTFVASPLTTPEGWQINNLPTTLTLRPFRSNLIFVVMSIPTAEVGGAVEEPFSVVISSQGDAGNQIVVPLRLSIQDDTFSIRLPKVNR